MILFFHVICLLARYFVSNISKSLSKTKVLSDDEEEEDIKSILPDYIQNKEYVKHPVYKDGTLKFFPPVYVQRFETVALILKDPVWKKKINKVVDFGCGELGFFMYLKNNENVTEILEVDIDSDLLERCANRAAPLTCDYLMNKRDQPLDVYIMAGNVAEFDDVLIGTDAVVCIEVIEHLDEEAFKNMPYNIFYKINPKLVIFTTPNADFNSLFPNFKDKRHEDHKFEWTRKEFFNWTQEILKLYPEYSARFYGIGAGPEGTENLGCCSQMVVFQRSDDGDSFSSAREHCEATHNFKLIRHFKYPFFMDTRTQEEKVIHEVQYQVSYYSNLPKFYNYENSESEIPLGLLKECVSDLCPDEEEFRNILRKNGMLLKQKNTSWFLVSTDSESSESDQRFKGEDWLSEDVSENFCDDKDPFLDEGSSGGNEIDVGNAVDLKTVRSLEDIPGNLVNQNEVSGEMKTDGIPLAEDEVKLPLNQNQTVKQMSLEKGECTDFCNNSNNNSNIKISINNNDGVNDTSHKKAKHGNSYGNIIEVTKPNLSRSRIPHKMSQSKEDKHSPERNSRKKIEEVRSWSFNLAKCSDESDWEEPDSVLEKYEDSTKDKKRFFSEWIDCHAQRPSFRSGSYLKELAVLLMKNEKYVVFN